MVGENWQHQRQSSESFLNGNNWKAKTQYKIVSCIKQNGFWMFWILIIDKTRQGVEFSGFDHMCLRSTVMSGIVLYFKLNVLLYDECI